MKVLRTTVAIALAFTALTSLAACGGRDVAATVNGEDIYVDQIDVELDALKEEYPQMFQGVDGEAREIDFRRRILDNLVTTLLVRQAAEDQGVDVEDADVDDALDEVKAGFPDEETFEQSLQEAGMTVEDLRGQIRDQLLTQAVLDMVAADDEVTDEDVEQYYEEHEAEFREEAAKRAAHILFATDDKETAEDVLAQIRDGADFEQMARQYSIDSATAERGGDLGWPSTPYVAEFESAVADLETGEVSDLVETVFGWHIITVVEEREERVRTLDEAREEIEAVLAQQQQADAYQRYVDELRDEAEIEYFVEYAPAE